MLLQMLYVHVFVLQAFDIAEQEFGIPAVANGQDMANEDMPDKLTMTSYLSHFYEYFRKESIRPAKS